MFVTLLVAGASVQTLAQPSGWYGGGLHRVQATQDIGADSAAAIARSVTGGRVLGVRSSQRGGRKIYAVRVLLPNGMVRTVRVDSQGGGIL